MYSPTPTPTRRNNADATHSDSRQRPDRITPIARVSRFEAFAGLATGGKTTPGGAPKNPLQLGATVWGFRHESRVTSPPIWVQNLILPRLWALAKAFGVRVYHDRWDSRISELGPERLP